MALSELRPADYNPRSITTEALGRLTKSLGEFGNLQPITMNAATGNLVGGHQRLKVLLAMGVQETDVWLVSLDPTKEKAANLQLNSFAGEWDEVRLVPLLEELRSLNVDLELTGFPQADLDAWMQNAGSGGEIDAEPQLDCGVELRRTYGVEPGDVWRVGRHRLACGDCTDPTVVSRCLAGANPIIMVTDPPYGVDYDPAWRNRTHRSDGTPIGGRAIGRVVNDHRFDWQAAWELFAGDVIYCWHAGIHSDAAVSSILAAGFEMRAQVIWAKSNFAIGRGDYHWQHEPCWYAVRKGRKGHWNGDRTQTTLWEIAKPQKSETGHSTQKPLECMARPIRNHDGDVYDPFLGSGTTMVAAENLGRTCYAIEILPEYVAIALQRMKDAFPAIEVRKDQ